MRYAGIIYDDTTAGPGLCLSFYVQGCPIQCEGCHNPHTWNFDGGYEFTPQVLDKIIEGINAQGVQRNFCVLGGEPLAPQNLFLTRLVVSTVRDKYPDIQIWLWSGYEMEQIMNDIEDPHMTQILSKVTGLVTGPFILAERDITLPMRGSRNQKIFIFDKKNNLWYNKENKIERFELNG